MRGVDVHRDKLHEGDETAKRIWSDMGRLQLKRTDNENEDI